MASIDSTRSGLERTTERDPRRVFVLVAAFFVLAAVGLSTLSTACTACFGDYTEAVQKAFWIDFERNFPTLVNFTLLVVCCGLSAVIAWHQVTAKAPWRLHWQLLTLMALLVAFDEAALVHEFISIQLRGQFDFTGYLSFAWVLPYGTVVVLVAFTYVRFLLALPRSAALFFVGGAMVYVLGAIGVELLGGSQFSQGAMDGATYRALVTLEETLEMCGASIVIYGLIDLLHGKARDKRRYLYGA